MFASLVLVGRSARRARKLPRGLLFGRMCSSLCGSFLCRVSTRRYTLPCDKIRIGIAILAPSKVRALRAVGEVCTSDYTLLEEEDG